MRRGDLVHACSSGAALARRPRSPERTARRGHCRAAAIKIVTYHAEQAAGSSRRQREAAADQCPGTLLSQSK